MGIAPNGRASRWLLMIAKPNLTQAELVRRGIERAIFNGDLAPGVVLEEGRLATLYGVSRTPVREAIANLVRSGLLTKTAHRRAIVSQLDSGKLLELFEALAEMEGLAARFAASRMSHQEKASLMDIHQRAATLLPVGDDPRAYAMLGKEFHQTILAGCRNRVLIGATSALTVRVFPYRSYQVVAPGRLESNQVDHDRIVDAIMAGDGEAAQEAMRKHTSDQGDTLVRFIALNKLPHDGLQVAEMDLSYTSEDIRS